MKMLFCSRLLVLGLMMEIHSSAVLVGNQKVIAVVLIYILTYVLAVVMKAVFY